jgi:pimeloyl-ACP methyl ester carboxylesterase
VLEHGALYRICFPATWNGDLVLYAHGYVPAQRDIAPPEDVIGGQSISGTLTGLGYAFATTSYRANGLVAPEATEDLVELEATVRRLYRPDPGRSVIVGFSEGGLVATLAAERYPELFDGALDAALNAGVQRHAADPVALAALGRFQTSGNLRVPLTTIHTTGDPIVPFNQSELYGEKVGRAGTPGLLTHDTIERYGHCAFQGVEVLSAFTTLMERVRARPAATVLALARP